MVLMRSMMLALAGVNSFPSSVILPTVSLAAEKTFRVILLP